MSGVIPSRSARSLGVLLATLVIALPGAGAAHAAALGGDTDHDGVSDVADPFPCDWRRSAVVFLPSEQEHGTLLFEDNWPAAGDLDFNDAVVGYQHAIFVNAQGLVTGLRVSIVPRAIGARLHSGLAIALPLPPSVLGSAVQVGGSGATLSPEPGESNLVLVLSPDLRGAFGIDQGFLNTDPALPNVGDAAPLVFELTFAQPAALEMSQDLLDLFFFRSEDPTHQVHRPNFRGTDRMNTALFGTADDGSNGARRFVDRSGLPFLLDLPTSAPWPRERVGIEALFPNITTFAASGGQSGADYYRADVDAAKGYPSSVAPAPSAPDYQLCVAPACDDGFQNGLEAGVDCGGGCAPCAGNPPAADVEFTFSMAFQGDWCDPGIPSATATVHATTTSSYDPSNPLGSSMSFAIDCYAIQGGPWANGVDFSPSGAYAYIEANDDPSFQAGVRYIHFLVGGSLPSGNRLYLQYSFYDPTQADVDRFVAYFRNNDGVGLVNAIAPYYMTTQVETTTSWPCTQSSWNPRGNPTYRLRASGAGLAAQAQNTCVPVTCTRRTCASEGVECGGPIDDGCGGTFECGGCGVGSLCFHNQCQAVCGAPGQACCGGSTCADGSCVDGVCAATARSGRVEFTYGIDFQSARSWCNPGGVIPDAAISLAATPASSRSGNDTLSYSMSFAIDRYTISGGAWAPGTDFSPSGAYAYIEPYNDLPGNGVPVRYIHFLVGGSLSDGNRLYLQYSLFEPTAAQLGQFQTWFAENDAVSLLNALVPAYMTSQLATTVPWPGFETNWTPWGETTYLCGGTLGGAAVTCPGDVCPGD